MEQHANIRTQRICISTSEERPDFLGAIARSFVCLSRVAVRKGVSLGFTVQPQRGPPAKTNRKCVYTDFLGALCERSAQSLRWI